MGVRSLRGRALHGRCLASLTRHPPDSRANVGVELGEHSRRSRRGEPGRERAGVHGAREACRLGERRAGLGIRGGKASLGWAGCCRGTRAFLCPGVRMHGDALATDGEGDEDGGGRPVVLGGRVPHEGS